MGHICVSGVLVDQHTALEEVFIFFDTATYDQVERDVKVNTNPSLKTLFLCKHRKNCECCAGHSDCQILTLNVMIQVSQFVRNSQLCH